MSKKKNQDSANITNTGIFKVISDAEWYKDYKKKHKLSTSSKTAKELLLLAKKIISGVSITDIFDKKEAVRIGNMVTSMLKADQKALGFTNKGGVILFNHVCTISDDGNFDWASAMQDQWVRSTGCAFLSNFLLMRKQFDELVLKEEQLEDKQNRDAFDVLLSAVDYTIVLNSPEEDFPLFRKEHMDILKGRIRDYYSKGELF